MEANGGGEGLEDLQDIVMVVSPSGFVAWVPAQALVPDGARGAIEAALRQNAWVPAEAAARTGWIPAPELLVLDGEAALVVARQYGWIHRPVEANCRQAVAPRNTAAANAPMGCNPALVQVFLRLPAQEIARCRTVCRGWCDVTSTEAFRRRDHPFRKHMPLFRQGAAAQERTLLRPTLPVDARMLAVGHDQWTALSLVLIYVPAREIARCRTVCALWRDITSTEAFLLDHRRHHSRNPMPLFFFLDPRLVRLNLRAVDIRDRVSRPVIAYTRPSNHEVLRIHGSCAGILLLSSGLRLYACNPCTRRWARLPPIHVKNDIIGFYVTPTIEFRVLFHDREKSDCGYWIFRQGTTAEEPSCIGRPGPAKLDLVLDNGIAPSYMTPPVFFSGSLHWPPKAAKDNINVLVFQASTERFSLVPPPSIRVGDEKVPVLGRQVFEIDQHLAMTVNSFSPPRVDVWVLGDTPALWTLRYTIRVPVEEINRNNSCHHNGSVFAVAQDRNDLVQCPRILLQCDALGDELGRYELAHHWIYLSGHTLEESLLHPAILPMKDTDAVDGDPPFFQN